MGEFLHREAQLQTVFNRLRKGESSAVIGEPHIGKTSFLLQLAEPAVQKRFLDVSDKKLHVQYIDLHSIENEYSPANFWEEAIIPISKIRLKSVEKQLEQIVSTGYSRRSLENLFTSPPDSFMNRCTRTKERATGAITVFPQTANRFETDINPVAPFGPRDGANRDE